jgi:hypothetical protein
LKQPFIKHSRKTLSLGKVPVMWRELIDSLAETTDYDYEFATPATYFQLDRVAQILRVKLPDTLRRLLLETNGVRQVMVYRDGRVPIGQIIWDVETIQRQNLKLRRNPAFSDFYLPFDELLFFASPGKDGVRFALRIENHQTTETVIAWNPTDDSRTEKATSLRTFIEAWLSGTLEV